MVVNWLLSLFSCPLRPDHPTLLGLYHTDASTRSEHSRQMTGAYVYDCVLTLARARALAEITRANIRVHLRCQRSAHAFTRVAEQEVGYLLIININFLLTRSENIIFAASTPYERWPRLLVAV